MTDRPNTKQRYRIRLLGPFAFLDTEKTHLWRSWQLFEFNSEILRMIQPHRSRAGKLQRFDHPRALDLTGSIPTLLVPVQLYSRRCRGQRKAEFGPLCPPRSPCKSQIDDCYPPGILTTLISIAEK